MYFTYVALCYICSDCSLRAFVVPKLRHWPIPKRLCVLISFKETPVNYSKPINKTISYLLTVLYVRTYCYPLNEPDWNLFLNCASKEQREEKKNVNKLKKEMFRAFWNTIFFHFPALLSVSPLNQKSPLIEYNPSHNLNDGAINGSIAQYID